MTFKHQTWTDLDNKDPKCLSYPKTFTHFDIITKIVTFKHQIYDKFSPYNQNVDL